MAYQDKNFATNQSQKEILDLEKIYFSKLQTIILSDDFKNDLRAIEREIKYDYDRLKSIWDLKNKIKVAAERLVCHHIYKKLMCDIRGIYESPISSDLGVVFDDCILCVDCKTLDTESNLADIRYTSVESNQISFDNSNFPYIPTASNLKPRARVSRLPVLTFIIKIIYKDTTVQFDISRTYGIGENPSLVLACIPNGELSALFEYNLIKNFKTYKYHKASDGPQYSPVTIPNDTTDIKTWVERYCESQNYTKVEIQQARGHKEIYYDAAHQCSWVYTSNNKTKMIRAILRGDTMRLDNKSLMERYDSKNERWNGYIETDI